MLIRQAKLEELPTILQWSCDFIPIALPGYPVDVEYITEFIKDMVKNHVVLVAEDEGVLKGMVAGRYVLQHYLNPNLTVLQEIAWWVPEEYRMDGIGMPLLRTFAELENTHITALALLTTSPALEGKLQGLGFEKRETAYVRNNKEL